MMLYSVRFRRWWGFWVASILLLCLVGCRGDDSPQKETLFGDDHHSPEHWPETVSDLRNKLRIRRSLLSTTDSFSIESDAYAELVDLVSWTPEVTADSDLSEAQWLTIYELSEPLARKLRSGGFDWTNATETQLEQLLKLLDQAAETLEKNRRDRQSDSDTNEETDDND